MLINSNTRAIIVIDIGVLVDLVIADVVLGHRGPVGRLASVLANSRVTAAPLKHVGQLRVTGHAHGVLGHNVVVVTLDVVIRGARELREEVLGHTSSQLTST